MGLALLDRLGPQLMKLDNPGGSSNTISHKSQRQAFKHRRIGACTQCVCGVGWGGVNVWVAVSACIL
jgi:hypothetical protein